MPHASKKRIQLSPLQYLMVGGLALVLLILLAGVWGIAQKEERARAAVNDRKAELAILAERRAVLEANLAELSTDRGREATHRQNQGVARAGEEVIIVVPQDEEKLGPKLPWYKRFLGWFGIW